MSGASEFKELLKARRRRVIADIMGSFERTTGWPTLDAAEQKHVRAAVYSAISAYHDVALDMLAVLTDHEGMVLIDQRVVAMIEDLHNDLQYDDAP